MLARAYGGIARPSAAPPWKGLRLRASTPPAASDHQLQTLRTAPCRNDNGNGACKTGAGPCAPEPCSAPSICSEGQRTRSFPSCLFFTVTPRAPVHSRSELNSLTSTQHLRTSRCCTTRLDSTSDPVWPILTNKAMLHNSLQPAEATFAMDHRVHDLRVCFISEQPASVGQPARLRFSREC